MKYALKPDGSIDLVQTYKNYWAFQGDLSPYEVQCLHQWELAEFVEEGRLSEKRSFEIVIDVAAADIRRKFESADHT